MRTERARRGDRRRLPARARVAAGTLTVGLAAVVLSGCGGSSGPIGAYTTTVRGAEEEINGTWKVTFGERGSYAVTAGEGKRLAVGKGSYYRGTTFVINPRSPNACGVTPSTGTYRLKLSGDRLTFIRIKDPCTSRATIFAHTFTKVRMPAHTSSQTTP